MSGRILCNEVSTHKRALIGTDSMKISALISAGHWRLPCVPDREFTRLWSQIGEVQLYPDLLCDELKWNANAKGEYAVKHGYTTLIPDWDKVSWRNIIWQKEAVPWHSTCAWRRLHKKLTTHNFLQKKKTPPSLKMCAIHGRGGK